ncbi:MAG: GIY-YIG nuclease family protein, partial [Flavobacteriales bacterium]
VSNTSEAIRAGSSPALGTMEACWTYAIASLSQAYIHVGLCGDVPERLARHQAGRERTTRPYRPFVLLLAEEHPDRLVAREREKYLKSGKGREILKELRVERWNVKKANQSVGLEHR